MSETTVPRALVEQIAAGYHDLMALHMRRGALQAELIRGCVDKLQQPVPAFPGPQREQCKSDKAQALLHLQWLATALEKTKDATYVSRSQHTGLVL